jgi:hypothetical protein
MNYSCPKAKETIWLIDQLLVASINLEFETIICAIVASFLGFIFGPCCAKQKERGNFLVNQRLRSLGSSARSTYHEVHLRHAFVYVTHFDLIG